MKFSYPLIEPLLIDSEVEGSEIICVFEIPGTGETVESSARIKRSNDLQSNVTRQVTRVGSNILRREASRLLRKTLGGGVLGRLGSSTLRGATGPMVRQSTQFSIEDKREAIVQAFKKVANRFYFDESANAWAKAPSAAVRSAMSAAAPPPLNPIEAQIEKAPLVTRFDREALARILVELASADGEISSEELEFLQSVIGTEFGDVNDLLAKDPLSPLECEELANSVRETIYLLAWVMCLVDLEINPNERNILMEYAGMFALSNTVVEDTIRKAKLFLLESYIDPDTTREELFDIADRLSFDRNEAERALIQLKKRV